MAFSPNGELLAAAVSSGGVRVWDLSTGRAVAEPASEILLQDNSVNGLAFSPNGRLLATADGDGTVRLWNPVTGQPVGAPMHAVAAQGGPG